MSEQSELFFARLPLLTENAAPPHLACAAIVSYERRSAWQISRLAPRNRFARSQGACIDRFCSVNSTALAHGLRGNSCVSDPMVPKDRENTGENQAAHYAPWFVSGPCRGRSITESQFLPKREKPPDFSLRIPSIHNE